MRRDITSGSGYVERQPTFKGTEEYNVEKQMAQFESGNTVAIAKGISNKTQEGFHKGFGATFDFIAEKTDDEKWKSNLSEWSEKNSEALRMLDDKEKYDKYNNGISYTFGSFIGYFAGDFVSPTGLSRLATEFATNLAGFATLGIPGVVAAQALNAGWSSKMTTYEEQFKAKSLGHVDDTTWGEYYKQELVVRAALLGAIGGGSKFLNARKAKKLAASIDESVAVDKVPESVVDDALKNKEGNGIGEKSTPEEIRTTLENEANDPTVAKANTEQNSSVDEYLDKYRKGEISKKAALRLIKRLEKRRTKEGKSKISLALDVSTNIRSILQSEVDLFKVGHHGEVKFEINKDNLSEELIDLINSNGEADVISQVLNKVMMDDPATKMRVALDYHDIQGIKMPEVDVQIKNLSEKDIREIMISANNSSVKVKAENITIRTPEELEVEAKEIIGIADAEKTVKDRNESLAKSAEDTNISKVKSAIEKVKDNIANEKIAVKQAKDVVAEAPEIKTYTKVQTEIEATTVEKKPHVTDEEIRVTIAKEASVVENKGVTTDSIALNNSIKSDISIVLKHEDAKVKKHKVKKKSPTEKYMDEVEDGYSFVKKAEDEKTILYAENSKLKEINRQDKATLKASKIANDKKLSKKLSTKIKQTEENIKKNSEAIKRVKTKSVAVKELKEHIQEFKSKNIALSKKMKSARRKLKALEPDSEDAKKIKSSIDRMKLEHNQNTKEMMRSDGYKFDVSDGANHSELVGKQVVLNDQPVVITDVRTQWNTRDVVMEGNFKKTRDKLISKGFDDEKHTYLQYTKGDGTTDYVYLEDVDWFDHPRLYAEEVNTNTVNVKYDPTNADFIYDPAFTHEFEEAARISRTERLVEEGFSAEEIASVEKKLNENSWSKTEQQVEAEFQASKILDELLTEAEKLDAETLVKVTRESEVQSINSNSYTNTLHSEYIFKGSKLGKKYSEFLKVRNRGSKMTVEQRKKYDIFKNFTEDEINSLEARRKMTKGLTREQKKMFLKDEKNYSTKKAVDNLKQTFKTDLSIARNRTNDPGELLAIDNLIKKINNEMRYEFINSYESKIITSMKSKDPKSFTHYEKSLLGKMSRIKGTKISSIRAKAKAHATLMKDNFGTLKSFSNVSSDLLLKSVNDLEAKAMRVNAMKELGDVKLHLKAKKEFEIQADIMYDMNRLSEPESASPYVHNELKDHYNAADEYNVLEITKVDTSAERLVKIKRNTRAMITKWNKKNSSDAKLTISTHLIDEDSLKMVHKILSEKDEIAGDSLKILEQYLKREGMLDESVSSLAGRKVEAINSFLEHRTYYQNMTGSEATLVRNQTKDVAELISNYDIKNLIKTCN